MKTSILICTLVLTALTAMVVSGQEQKKSAKKGAASQVFQLPETVRYNERTSSERVNGRLKDEFGCRHVRVRGAAKVMCHCMFGILVVTADQLMRFVT